MCGIYGQFDQSARLSREQIRSLGAVLQHRGPDGSGAWFDSTGRIGLCSQRLAIQDLSEAGKMPMSAADGEVQLVFNGEIYNFRELRQELRKKSFRFVGTSDTEVLLYSYIQWGKECLDQIDGMYAFALYDERKATPGNGRLFLARDRAGEKPLYYWEYPGGFAFASELKALMAHPEMPRKLDYDAFEKYLQYGYVPGESCILEDAQKLPAAHALTYDLGQRKRNKWKYWDLPKQKSADWSRSESVDRLESLLRESVRERLIADVPVGILLSGGVDSSLVTAMAAEVSSEPVRTFTITFPGHGRYNEAPYARKVADYFGTDHHELEAEPASVDLLPDLAAQFDEPLADSSLIPTYLVSKLTRDHVTVALGGDGGDELFAGYNRYSRTLQQEHLHNWLPSALWEQIGRATIRLPVGLKGRNYLRELSHPFLERVRCGNLFDGLARRRLLSEEVQEAMDGSVFTERVFANGEQGGSGNLVDKMTRWDFRNYLVDDILTKVDRASMAVSLEVRAPFLDREIVNFAFRDVPSSLKCDGKEKKILPKLLANRLLPEDLDTDRKQGFSIPLDDWLEGAWGNYCSRILADAPNSLFDQGELSKLMRGQSYGLSNSSRIFALTMFELWRRHYDINI